MSASRTGHQINGLYPIVRRARRPLLPPDEAKSEAVSQSQDKQRGPIEDSDKAKNGDTNANKQSE